MKIDQRLINVIYGLLLLACMLPIVSPIIALGSGLLLSLLGLKPTLFSKYTSFFLQASIVLMGFGMDLSQVISVSKDGFVDTAISVVFVMLSGLILSKLFRVESRIGILISAGTAICGGSAIAAISPVLNARNHQISFSLVVVFVLNALALVVFPIVGHYLNLSQEQFGYWAAIAIHDTSSVVGAAAIYGERALEIATTVKLIRALWIIPLSLLIAFSQKKNTSSKIKIPWFIGLFVMSILVAYYFPNYDGIYHQFKWLGNRGLVMALFLIGSGISISDVKKAGLNSFVMGFLLWLLIALAALCVICY